MDASPKRTRQLWSFLGTDPETAIITTKCLESCCLLRHKVTLRFLVSAYTSFLFAQ